MSITTDLWKWGCHSLQPPILKFTRNSYIFIKKYDLEMALVTKDLSIAMQCTSRVIKRLMPYYGILMRFVFDTIYDW